MNDELLWKKEIKLRKPSIAVCLTSVLYHPIVAVQQAGRHLKASFRKPGSMVIHKELPDWWTSKKRLWIELIAVDSNKRGTGLAGILLDHCQVKTKELGRRAIALRVASNNTPAKRLYEKHGFIRYQSDTDTEADLYVKFINS